MDSAGDSTSRDGNQTADGGSSGEAEDGPPTVGVGVDGDRRFDPASLTVSQGTSVRWEWHSDGHNVEPDESPESGRWEGHRRIEDEGYVYEHTFEVAGRYEYFCRPHVAEDMVGEIIVESDPEYTPDRPILVGPNGKSAFQPAERTVEPGTTVRWEWRSGNHNLVPTSIPSDATWDGHPEISNEGTMYEHTFEVAGTYEYACEPHRSIGMTGAIHVETL